MLSKYQKHLKKETDKYTTCVQTGATARETYTSVHDNTRMTNRERLMTERVWLTESDRAQKGAPVLNWAASACYVSQHFPIDLSTSASEVHHHSVQIR